MSAPSTFMIDISKAADGTSVLDYALGEKTSLIHLW